jgi:dihydroorotate dehydrogenase electron transfer subunit
MQQFQATVRSNSPLTSEAFLLSLEAPESVKSSVRPGQFFHIRCGLTSDPLLRRPISLYRLDREKSLIQLMVRRAGVGTRWLAGRGEGEVIDLIGPLGRGFVIDGRTRHLVLLAGGIGVAPLVAAADESARKGLSVLLLAGAASEDRLLPGPALPREVEYRVATEDGSVGHHGLVTDLLAEAALWADQVLACGPEGMLATVAAMKRAGKMGMVDVQMSLERRMGCAVGACLWRGNAETYESAAKGRCSAWRNYSGRRSGGGACSWLAARAAPEEPRDGRVRDVRLRIRIRRAG